MRPFNIFAGVALDVGLNMDIIYHLVTTIRFGPALGTFVADWVQRTVRMAPWFSSVDQSLQTNRFVSSDRTAMLLSQQQWMMLHNTGPLGRPLFHLPSLHFR